MTQPRKPKPPGASARGWVILQGECGSEPAVVSLLVSRYSNAVLYPTRAEAEAALFEIEKLALEYGGPF